jgi:translation initiation factor IF-3
VPQVRLIDQEGEALGVKPTREALMLAEQAGLDLVEIAASADPPVCRIMDYGKFKYEKSKKTKEARKKQHVVHLKEVKFRPKTGDHDYQYKMQHARGFLVDSDRVKATVVFRGREITHIEFGEQLLQRLTLDLADLAQVELGARREGRNLISVYVPDKDKVIKFVRAQEQAKKRQQALEATQAAAAQPAAAVPPQEAVSPQA